MTSALFAEYNSLNNLVNAAKVKKIEKLTCMNNLVGSFDESRKFTHAEEHVEGYWAVVIIEDAGDYSGADYYRKLHPQLMDAMGEERLAIEELEKFLSSINLTSVKEFDAPLSVLGIKSGKIVVDVVGRA